MPVPWCDPRQTGGSSTRDLATGPDGPSRDRESPRRRRRRMPATSPRRPETSHLRARPDEARYRGRRTPHVPRRGSIAVQRAVTTSAGFSPPVCQPWLVVVATVGLPSSAARSALRAACGDGGTEPSLSGREVGPGRADEWSGCGGDHALHRGVLLRVAGVVVLPETPDHLARRAAEDPAGVRVAGAAGACAVIDVRCPRVVPPA
jgi:hypothetical protein